MLEELRASVVKATSAAEGLELFAQTPIDAVLSDMVMPGEMNGLDMARAIREQRPDIPLVLMTGYSSAAEEAEVEGFTLLRKPFTMEILAQRLVQEIGTARPEA